MDSPYYVITDGAFCGDVIVEVGTDYLVSGYLLWQPLYYWLDPPNCQPKYIAPKHKSKSKKRTLNIKVTRSKKQANTEGDERVSIQADALTDAEGDTHTAKPQSLVKLRRTWPQRFVVVACVGVIISALLAAYGIDFIHQGAQKVNRIDFTSPANAIAAADSNLIVEDSSQGDTSASLFGLEDGKQLLQSETPDDGSVNFLVVGTDSALGLNPADPVLHGRYVDPTGRSMADVIMLVRINPTEKSGWALSIPRDLWVEIPRGPENRVNSALWISGPPLLVETVTRTFGVEINHYVQIDFAGFQLLVDALGGVPVWFRYPTRDKGSRLNIPVAGCYILDGRQALQYVRGRHYTELIRGRWRITGGSDLSRIERQQDFILLALNHAMRKGFTNPNTLLKLFETTSEMIALDQEITIAELLDLGLAVMDIGPSNLHFQRLEVYPLSWPDGRYKGEAAYVRANQAILDVFRGRADTVRSTPEELYLVYGEEADLLEAAADLQAQGFVVLETETTEQSIPATVIMHGPDSTSEALTIARYLNPLPYIVEWDSMKGIVVVLGDDYKRVRSLHHPSLADVEAQLTLREAPPPETIPSLKDLGFASSLFEDDNFEHDDEDDNSATEDGFTVEPAAYFFNDVVNTHDIADNDPADTGNALPSVLTETSTTTIPDAIEPPPTTSTTTPSTSTTASTTTITSATVPWPEESYESSDLSTLVRLESVTSREACK